MEIYLVRHGQTSWNKDFRWQGHTDIELDEVGKTQAAKVAVQLGRLASSGGFAALYASPLKRARMTAEAIGDELKLSPFFHEGLIEISFGHWEGLTLPEVRQLHAD